MLTNQTDTNIPAPPKKRPIIRHFFGGAGMLVYKTGLSSCLSVCMGLIVCCWYSVMSVLLTVRPAYYYHIHVDEVHT